MAVGDTENNLDLIIAQCFLKTWVCALNVLHVLSSFLVPCNRDPVRYDGYLETRYDDGDWSQDERIRSCRQDGEHHLLQSDYDAVT